MSPGRKNVWRGGSKVIVNSHEAPMIGFDTCRRGGSARQYWPPSPPHDTRAASALSRAPPLEKFIRNAARRLLERLDIAEVLAHHYSCRVEGDRDRGGYVIVSVGRMRWPASKVRLVNRRH